MLIGWLASAESPEGETQAAATTSVDSHETPGTMNKLKNESWKKTPQNCLSKEQITKTKSKTFYDITVDQITIFWLISRPLSPFLIKHESIWHHGSELSEGWANPIYEVIKIILKGQC